ncbi:hypothetical protein [Magnetospirillum molischianum]|uniref:Uncharacterized protein n=1 Tax=Magnetospirillum molischianum DSM 120 TaxID=1150626 RepID=H8FPF5_MAGML|nr:hypothetical protein [Magnetospirillum molischianum]CCG40243.1 conserved hypothetical protein [Magnetospirillum molischianum DSM 120]
MSPSDPHDAMKAFEAKATSLIAATRSLDIPRILLLRRLTLADEESRKWASEKQLNVVFSVVLAKAAERLGLPVLKALREQGLTALLPNDTTGRAEDLRVLSEVVTQLLGPPEMSEAEAVRSAFRALIARDFAPSPERIARTQTPLREPPPLFAAQLGPATERRVARVLAVPVTGEPDPASVPDFDFGALFDETLCTYAQKTLSMFRIAGPSHGVRLPFLLAPEFGQAYREVLQRFVLPQMRATRHIQTLAQSTNWAEAGPGRLTEIIQGSEVNNPILHNWDSRWASFRAGKSAKGRKTTLKPNDNPWPLLREEATRCNFLPPGEDDLVLLKDVIRFEADAMAKCWRELGQLYTQEFVPSGRPDQGREGSLRDGIIKWVAKLPDHVGEHLAIKAMFEFERIDAAWLRKLLVSFGRTDSERRRVVPYLTDFLAQL